MNYRMTYRRMSLAAVFFIITMICVLSGQAMAQQDTVLIPQDPAGGGYQAFPDVTRLSDGRLMAVFYSGYGHLSPPSAEFPKGGRIDRSYSSDEGYTWSTPTVLYDGVYDDRDPSIMQRKNGQLILTYMSDLPVQQGSEPYSSGVHTLTSNDLGATWSEPRQVYSDYWSSSPVRELSDGRLIMPAYYQTGSSAADGEAFGAVGISDDSGQTWSAAVDIPLPELPQEQWLPAETDVIERNDGSLYAAQRANSGPMFFSTSTDRGESWSQSQALGWSGHCPYLHRTEDDIILLAYRNPPEATTSFRYSLDECQTWSEEVVVDTVGGAYPSIVDLVDGSQLIFYGEEGTSADVRIKRFRATAAGVEWLPVEPVPEPMTLVLLGLAGLGLCKKRKTR